MAAVFASTVRCLLLVWLALVGGADGSLKARRLAVSFAPAGSTTNTITIVADYIVGTLIVTGSSTGTLDIATLSNPWMNTLEDLTGGLAVIVSITTNVLSEVGSSKTHQMTINYRILPVDGTALDLSLLLSDSSTLDDVIWSTFAANCVSDCSEFNPADSDTGSNWGVSSESTAVTETAEVEYPATFNIAATTTTKAAAATTTTGASTGGGSGSSGGSVATTTTASSGSGGSGYQITTTTTVASSCGKPIVTGLEVTTDWVATFTWCEQVAFRAGQYVYFQLYDSDGTDVEGQSQIPILSSDFVGTTSFEVDVSDYISAGIFFRLVLKSGAVADSSATLSEAYTSTLFAVASSWWPASAAVEEDEGLSTVLIGVIAAIAALVVILFLCCVCLCRLLYFLPSASNDDNKQAPGWNFFYMNTPSMNLGKISRVHPSGVGIVVQGVPESAPNMLTVQDPPKSPIIKEGMSPNMSLNSMSNAPSVTTSRPIVSARNLSKITNHLDRSPRQGRGASKLSTGAPMGQSPNLSPHASPAPSPGVSPRLDPGHWSPTTGSSWSSPRSVAT